MPAGRPFEIDGIVPIIPTPFHADESIDFAAIAPLIRFAAEGGCSAVCLPAYASEFYKLSDEERILVVRHAVAAAQGRIPVIGQANHPSARHAARCAMEVEAAGADAVAVAVPHLMPLAESALLRYFDTILSCIGIPLLIQDYNPGGPTLGARFVADLHGRHPHFRYLKLEEPLMAGKVKAIVEATGGGVGVLEGWGGMFMLELMDAGIRGVMPGLAVSDLLARVWRLAAAGGKLAAYDLFAQVLPQIIFSLQNMEFFHHVEKGLLAMRGLLPETTARGPAATPDPVDAAHAEFLNRRILALVGQDGAAPAPAAAPAPRCSVRETVIHSLPAIALENEWVRATILPEPGAKLYDLVSKKSGRSFLWHNPRILPQRFPVDSNFDNSWCGGWDDGFPTCDACEYGGENYPNLGELRSLAWNVEEAGTRHGDAVVRLSASGPISPVLAQKTVTLEAGAPVIAIDYKIEHLGALPLDFIWGTHPALAAGPDAVLKIPARTGIVAQSSGAAFGEPGQRYRWPVLETPGGVTDMSRVRDRDARLFCGHCATDLDAGWYAVEHQATGEGFLLQFPKDELPCLWMWLVYGGWRGYHHVIVEPWTSFPVRLSEAVREQTHRRLEPGGTFAVRIRATVYGPGESLEQALQRMERG